MYPLAEKRPSGRRRLIALVVVLVVVYFLGRGVLGFFGFIHAVERMPVLLSVEDRGIVTAQLEGGESKHAENGMKLFTGEKVSTGPNGNASLRFFDTSVVRLDESTDLTIVQSNRAQGEASVALRVEKGSIWISTPAASGSTIVARTVATPLLSYTIPPRTEAVLSPSSLTVFRAAGEGITVTASKHEKIVIGEGQKLTLPKDKAASALAPDLYTYRSPLDAASMTMFVSDSRRLAAAAAGSSSPVTASGSAILTVTKPGPNEIADRPTVSVTGTFGTNVDAVKINGYPAVLDREKGTFAQEISIPDGETQFSIRIQALDAKQAILAESTRIVRRSAAASDMPAPTVTAPAKTGETYKTNAEEVILRGTSPQAAAAIYVNNYKLQLFSPEKGTWSYLASLRLGNMKAGTNTYDVVAEDAEGKRSPAASITIVSGQGDDGVVSAGGSSSSAAAVLDPAKLPANAPLQPGTLKVSGAAAQMGFVATGTGFLLEGQTGKDTASIWVNGYQLKLYKAGKTFWNYLASPELKTIATGKNIYKVVARDASNQILDQIDVTVEYK